MTSASLPREDEAAQGLVGQVLAPVVERTQALVVAAVLVAVVDRHVAEVHEVHEALRVGRLVVVGQLLLGLLEQRLDGVLPGRPLGAGQLEVGRSHEQPVLLRGHERRAHDALGVSREVVEPVLGPLLAGSVLGVVLGPFPERERGAPRLLDDLLAELDGLGEDDLFLGVEEGDLADLLEVHADGVVDADHVLGHGLELGLGVRLVVLILFELGRRLPPRLLLRLLDGDLHAELTGHAEVPRCADDVFLFGLDGVAVHVSLAPLEDRCHEQLVGGVSCHVLPPLDPLAWG